MAEDTQLSDAKIKRNQIEVLSVAEGFFQSSVLFALLKLNIFELIGGESKSTDDLAKALQVQPETLARLLKVGAILKLLESKDGFTFRLSPTTSSVLLPSAGKAYIGDWIRNMEYFAVALTGLDKAIKTAEPTVVPSDHLGGDIDCTREFTFAMHNYASLRGGELADFLDTTACRTLLDLGCGPGTYAFHLGLQNPGLQLYLSDRPETLAVAKEVQAQYPIENAVEYLPLNIVTDEIPASYDLILVSNTLHMLGEQESMRLVKRLYEKVNEGGSLVIQAQYLRDDGMGPRWPLLLDLLQLCMTTEGRNHSVGETRGWLEEAGFVDIEYCPMTILNTNSFLRGYKR